MFARGSITQPRAALTGSGALSHVYVQYPPLRCAIPGAKGLFYDDGSKLLLSPTSDRVYAWQTGLGATCETPNSDLINDGPILSIRYSLDGKIIGIHRSNHEIEFKNRETGATFYGKCKGGSESILGFFWTDCPTCDVVFIKTSGVDLYAYEVESNALRLVETKRLYVSWYVYTHESRLVLLASGMQCKSLTGYQFSSGGIMHLPKFEVTMTKAEVNKKPILGAEDVHIITVYGRIYCLQVDWVGMLLRLYRFYRDAVIQQGSFPIYSKVSVSVVDNVLLVHQVDAKVVLLYDIFLDSQAPVSAPLPLLVRGLPASNTVASQTSSKQAEPLFESIETNGGTVYGDSWSFLIPDLICDAAHGTLWKIYLDLEAIVTSSSEVPSLLEFLQRRRSEPSKIKELCMALMRTMILERRPLLMVARAMDVLTVSYSHAVKLESSLKGGSGKVYSERSSSAEGDGSSTGGVQHMDSASTFDRHGRSAKNNFQGRIMETDPLHQNLEHDRHRLSLSSASDNEDNVNIENLSLKSEETLQMPLSSGLSGPSSTGVDGKSNKDQEAIYNDSESTSLQAETSGSRGYLLGSNATCPLKSRIASVAISPEEMYSSVFSLIEEEMVGDPAYLVAVIIEYLKSVAMEKLKVPPDLYVLATQLLIRNERYVELAQFVRNQIFEPSKQVAFQLLGSGNENFSLHKLGMDMLRQLSLHQDYVLVLLRDGYYLEALRYARRNKVYTIRPSLFLDAAVATNDPQCLASVLRFFLDFKPDFKNTSDYNTFSNILNEMTCSVY